MKDFFVANWPSILVAAIIIALMVLLYFRGKKDLVKKIILSLVLQAEKTLGSGTGELKYAMVVERAYTVLPALIRFFITKKELDRLIEEAVQYMKKQLQAGKNLVGYDDEYNFKQIADIVLQDGERHD